MRINIRVNGIDRAVRIGDLISSNVARAIEQEVDAGSKEMRTRERSLAPKKTGKLRRSIVIRRGRYGISKMVRAKAPHAPLQEFGTRRGVVAKHFAERAKNELTPVIESRLRAAIAREVER